MRFHTPHWQERHQLSNNRLNSAEKYWLFSRGSLTYQLIKHCSEHFELDLVSQNHAKPYRDESDIMSLTQGEQSLIRQVRLRCGNEVQIFARSVIPLQTLHGKAQRLRHLGKRPLAELLYTTRSTQRLHMQYGLLKQNTPLYKLASASLKIESPLLWARRSVFMYENSPLLVCEVFSPRLLQQVPA